MTYNIKSIRKSFKEKWIFYTEEKLAILMKSFIDIEISEVYDPTCGDWWLLSIFDDSIQKYWQEINQDQLNIANGILKNFTWICWDTLKEPAFIEKKFSCIIANPPFSIKWDNSIDDVRFKYLPCKPPNSKADYAFIAHILHYLSNDWIAIVLNFPWILYRSGSEWIIRKYLVDKNHIEKIIRIPWKYFIDTNIETCLIIFRKNKIDTNIEFIDIEKWKKHIATLSDIIENNYILSVNRFIKEENIVVQKDPVEMQKNSRCNMLRNLQSDIDMDRMICSMEWYDFKEYINKIQDLLNTYKSQ